MKKLISLLLAAVMVFTSVPMTALAASQSVPDFQSMYSYTEPGQKSINLVWAIPKKYYKYAEGFDVLKSEYGKKFKLLKTVKVEEYKKKKKKEYRYKIKDSTPSPYAYVIDYKIKPYYTANGKKKYIEAPFGISQATYADDSMLDIKTTSDSVSISIKKLPHNPVYSITIYKYVIKSGKYINEDYIETKKRTYKIKNVNTKKYGFEIGVLPIWKKVRLDYGAFGDTNSAYALLNGAPKMKSASIKVINTREKKSFLHWTYTPSKSDVKTIKKFFKKAYKGNYPSRAAMAEYAFNWIHKNVDYDYSYTYGDGSYVDAIFNHRAGQCLQYNGAFAAVLTYLGYEARIIEGYRFDYSGSPTINHFWCEVKLNGRWYLCETGNYGKNGDWKHFVVLYRNANGYSKNGKPVK